jgi:hypothetical protein
MKEIVGLFMLLYTLGEVALERQRPEVFLYRLERYSKGKPMCASTVPVEKRASCTRG